MPRGSTSPGLRALFVGGTATGATDGQLLERFRSRGGSIDPAAAEAAFEALVDRHAAMVWGVCRRGLRDRSDVEDAFQATFLVLVRRAGSVRADARGSVGRWLYGVARKVAARRRRDTSRRPAPAPAPAGCDDPALIAERQDVREAVAVELDRLPPKYRRPIELCDCEGLTYEQAGLALGWPTATIKSRLARGRLRLRHRLARRGLAPLAAIATAALAKECRAGAPPALVHSTTRAGAIASGMIPGAVARLAEGALRTMMWDKIRPLALIALAGLGVGTSVATTTQEAPDKTTVEPEDAASPFSRRLGDGTLIEVVAISDGRPTAPRWWRPDGSPMPEAPCDPAPDPDAPRIDMGLDEPVDARGFVKREFLVKFSGHRGEDDFQAHFVGYPGFSARPVERGGKTITDMRRITGRYPRQRPSLSLSFREMLGRWETTENWQGAAATNHALFSGPIASRDGTVVSLTHEFDLETPFRLIAVDADAATHVGRYVVAAVNPAKGLNLLTLEYDTPPERIEAFHLQVQTRPPGKVEIPGIALHPRKADDPR